MSANVQSYRTIRGAIQACKLQAPAYTALARSHASKAWVAACTTAKITAKMMLTIGMSLGIWVVFFIGAMLVKTITGTVYYARNPHFAVLDAVSAYTRSGRWLQLTVLSFILSNSWGYGWARQPLKINVAGGKFTNAEIVLDTHVGRAVAIMYQLSDMPTLSDLLDTLDMYGSTCPMHLPKKPIIYYVWLTGPSATTRAKIQINIEEQTVLINEDIVGSVIEFYSLSLDSILRKLSAS